MTQSPCVVHVPLLQGKIPRRCSWCKWSVRAYKYHAGPDIKVEFPADSRVRFLIDSLASYVVSDGCSFEMAAMSAQGLMLSLPSCLTCVQRSTRTTGDNSTLVTNSIICCISYVHLEHPALSLGDSVALQLVDYTAAAASFHSSACHALVRIDGLSSL